MILAITGASGFIGREIVRQSLASGYHVRSISRQAALPVNDHEASFRGDIVSGTGLSDAFSGADILIHAAGLAHQRHNAYDPDYAAVNGEAVGRTVRTAIECGVTRIVLVSSVAVYGGTASNEIAHEGYRTSPINNYGMSKLLGESAAVSEVSRATVGLRILRLATVFGAGDPGNFVRLIRAVHRRRFVRVGDGTARKSVIHRIDAARACLAAADDETSGTCCFNVVSGRHFARDIVSAISKLIHVPLLPITVPRGVSAGASYFLRLIPGRARDLARSLERWQSDEAYSGSALEQRYNFRPRIRLEEGLAEEVAWYLATADRHS